MPVAAAPPAPLPSVAHTPSPEQRVARKSAASPEKVLQRHLSLKDAGSLEALEEQRGHLLKDQEELLQKLQAAEQRGPTTGIDHQALEDQVRRKEEELRRMSEDMKSDRQQGELAATEIRTHIHALEQQHAAFRRELQQAYMCMCVCIHIYIYIYIYI